MFNLKKKKQKLVVAPEASEPVAAPVYVNESQRSHYLGDHTALTYTYFNRKIYVETRDISLTPHILTDGRWEPWVCTFFERNLKPGMVAYDLGANCGFFSLLAAHLVGPTGHVVAFEPQLGLADKIRKSTAINGFDSYLSVVAKGASNTNENLKLYKIGDYFGSSTLLGNADEFETIEVAPANEVIGGLEKSLNKDLSPDFVKIDVEGFEPYAWQGLMPLFEVKKKCTVLMEYTPSAYEAQPWGAKGFVEMIENAGFCLNKLNTDGTVEKISKDGLLSLSVNGYLDLVLEK